MSRKYFYVPAVKSDPDSYGQTNISPKVGTGPVAGLIGNEIALKCELSPTENPGSVLPEGVDNSTGVWDIGYFVISCPDNYENIETTDGGGEWINKEKSQLMATFSENIIFLGEN
mgnify:CR=1 FL=1|tara:strand:+ start:85 stop:429 length:345 start_codon:yes stop_codon:yes gene_type:complete